MKHFQLQQKRKRKKHQENMKTNKITTKKSYILYEWVWVYAHSNPRAHILFGFVIAFAVASTNNTVGCKIWLTTTLSLKRTFLKLEPIKIRTISANFVAHSFCVSKSKSMLSMLSSLWWQRWRWWFWLW